MAAAGAAIRVLRSRRVGLTYVAGRVRATGSRQRLRPVRFLVDSGAVYSVLRRAEWKAMRLKPERDVDFVLADGTSLTRGVSECSFEIEGRRATSPVVLGETKDEALLGAVTLETLGLMLNPLSRTLQPMRMMLAGFTGRRAKVSATPVRRFPVLR
jgi:predicted aspartyl protease